MTEYTLTLNSESDYRILKKILRAFDGATIRRNKIKSKNIEKAFSVEETLTERICNGLIEVKLIEDKVLPSKLAKDFLNEI
ncbi:MAG: hypothetical protein K2H46_07805 [Muribaculaceae bacterium]|nr:hypothetical protein [Muribaculaceae bacterium]